MADAKISSSIVDLPKMDALVLMLVIVDVKNQYLTFFHVQTVCLDLIQWPTIPITILWFDSKCTVREDPGPMTG